MESMASTSSPNDNYRLHHRFNAGKPLAEHVIRAINHRLCLLHRSDSMLFILGSTGNVYVVNLCTTPSCTCPDCVTCCKHILFGLDDSCLWRRTLRPCQLNRLMNLPTMNEALASATIRKRFRRMYFRPRPGDSRPSVVVEEGSVCPICLEEMVEKDKMVACGTCRNGIHEECFLAWKRSGGRRNPPPVCSASHDGEREQMKRSN